MPVAGSYSNCALAATTSYGSRDPAGLRHGDGHAPWWRIHTSRPAVELLLFRHLMIKLLLQGLHKQIIHNQSCAYTYIRGGTSLNIVLRIFQPTHSIVYISVTNFGEKIAFFPTAILDFMALAMVNITSKPLVKMQ